MSGSLPNTTSVRQRERNFQQGWRRLTRNISSELKIETSVLYLASKFIAPVCGWVSGHNAYFVNLSEGSRPVLKSSLKLVAQASRLGIYSAATGRPMAKGHKEDWKM